MAGFCGKISVSGEGKTLFLLLRSCASAIGCFLLYKKREFCYLCAILLKIMNKK